MMMGQSHANPFFLLSAVSGRNLVFFVVSALWLACSSVEFCFVVSAKRAERRAVRVTVKVSPDGM